MLTDYVHCTFIFPGNKSIKIIDDTPTDSITLVQSGLKSNAKEAVLFTPQCSKVTSSIPIKFEYFFNRSS